MGRAELQDHLVLGAQVQGLPVAPAAQIPHVQGVPVLACEEQVRIRAILHHIGGAPLAGDHGVVAQMPVEVIREVLRSAAFLPGPRDVEGLVVQDEDPTWPLAVWGAEGIHVDPVGPAVRGVGRAVPDAAGNRLCLDALD